MEPARSRKHSRRQTMKAALATLLIPVVTLAIGVQASHAASPVQHDRPNILLIMADDLRLHRPRQLRQRNRHSQPRHPGRHRGQDDQFYASPFCSPTRAMLMSGTDNHLAGFGDMAELMLPEQRGKPGYEGYLNDAWCRWRRCCDAGYRTRDDRQVAPRRRRAVQPGRARLRPVVCAGAWRLQPLERRRGIVAADPAKPPKAIYRENSKETTLPKDFFSSDFFTSQADRYIDAAKVRASPSSPTSPSPRRTGRCIAHDADIARYEQRYKDGYDKLRRERLERMKEARPAGRRPRCSKATRCGRSGTA